MAKKRSPVRRARAALRAKTGINTALVLDIAIANAAVKLAPALVNKLLPAGSELSGIVKKLAGGAAGYVVGTMVLNKPMVANAAIAIAASDIAVDYISPYVGITVNPVMLTPVSPSGTKALPPSESSNDLSDFLRLQGYAPAGSMPTVTDNSKYYNN